MVDDIVTKLYGHLEGRPYTFDESSLSSLQQAAESFIEKMWKHIKEKARQENRRTIDKQDFDVWKNTTGFKLRIKFKRGSLCDCFKPVKKRRRTR